LNTNKVFGIVGSTVLAATLLLNPYGIQWGKEETKASASSFNRDLFVSSNSDFHTLISDIKKDKLEDQKLTKSVLDKREIKLSHGNGKTASLEGYEDLLFKVQEVREDKELQKKLEKAIKTGAKVYLYGGVSVPEFADLLNLDKVTADGKDKNGKTMTFRFDEHEADLAKVNKFKKNPNAAYEYGKDFVYDLVGYTFNENEENKLIITNINSYDKDGNDVETTEEEILSDVLLATAQTIDAEEKKYAVAQSPKLFGFLLPNSAKAEVTTVKSNDYRIYGYANYGGITVGRTITDWILQKATSDGSSTWDFFNVMDRTTIDASDGYAAKKLWVDHDIPYDRDYIWDWDPGDTSSGSYSVGAEAPWGFSVGYEFTTDPVVDEIGNQDLDYGRWSVTDNNMDGERFKPGTFWKSSQSARYARMTITERGTFQKISANYYSPVSSDVSIAVSYSY